MNAGNDYAAARRHAQANANADRSPRTLHMYGGTWWIDRLSSFTTDTTTDPPTFAIPPGAEIIRPTPQKRFRILSNGADVLGGPVSEDNVYIRTYGVLVDGYPTVESLEVGEITRKVYSLSGTSGTYTIERVE